MYMKFRILDVLQCVGARGVIIFCSQGQDRRGSSDELQAQKGVASGVRRGECGQRGTDGALELGDDRCAFAVSEPFCKS